MRAAHAVNFQDRIPTVTGKKLGILTDLANTPIQDLGADLDIDSSTTGYIAILNNNNILETTELESLEVITKGGGKFSGSCKILLQNMPSLQDQDGEYYLSLGGEKFQKVYCDMTTDGGGWTFFLRVEGSVASTNFFEEATGTYMSDRSSSTEHYSLSSKRFEHTEMMFTADSVDPSTSSNLVIFRYNQGNSMFNKGPIPCIGPVDFEFKQSIDGAYQPYGSATACSVTQWYTRTGPGGADYLLLFHSSASFRGNYSISNPGWGKDGYWYLR